MNTNTLDPRSEIESDSKTEKVFSQFESLLKALRKRELPEEAIEGINKEVEKVNAAPLEKLKNTIRKSQTRILRVVEKEAKVVPVNYYRNLWLALGMSVFGMPLGVVLGTTLGSMAYLAVGLPIGLSMGIAIGTNMDKKAKEEGRQLEFELKN